MDAQQQDGGVTQVRSNGDGAANSTGTSNSNNELELLRERDYPFYKPAAGVGSSTAGTSTPGGGPGIGAGLGNGSGSSSINYARGHEVITNKEPSTIQAPTASERERAGYFGGGPSKGSSGTGGTGQGTFRHSQPYTRPSYSTNAGVSTPSTSFGYSPAPPTTTDSSEANSEVDEYERDREREHEGEHLAARSVTAAESSSVVAPSPDWLPSPVVEETEDDLLSRQASRNVISNVAAQQPSAAATAPTASSTTAKVGQDESLAAHMEALAMEGIQVVPSTSAPAPLQATAPVPASSTAKPAEAATSVPKEAISTGAGLPPARQGSNATIMPQRPAAPEHKKSILGKLFGGHKDKDKHADHSNTSSAAGSPHPTMTGDSARPGLATTGKTTSTRGRAGSSAGTRTPSASGAESDTSASTAPTTAAGSASGSTVKDKDHSALANLLHRRMSNKKMPQPDPSLIAMANASKAGQNVPAGQSPGASNATLSAGGYLNASSTVASRGSTPDVTGVPPPSVSANRGANPSPARSGTATPAESAGGRPMMRRPSGSAAGGEGGKADRTYTPTGEQHQVKEKSLKEHLAALGNAGSMMGKLNRKTSQTSKRSDDGRSERSGGGGHFYQEDPDHHPHPPAPKRAPSVGGQSNASTSLAQKYGICEKVAIGKGATAVVKLAHKWDRSTEKLYAVKEFRKRRKNESEKEYVKKLTSEFCISSTLHHINVVETVDLVQNEEKHWCEVMEYCPGGDLYSAIKKGTMTTEDINIYFKQIATGVAYLHSMGVAHRDIKPENLLLDNLGHIKITDFGVSDVFRMCWEKQTHMSKGLCGSEPYIAPEQFEQKEYDARLVDVWACAVVFYCMQAQELPWRVAKPSDPSFASYLHNFPSSVVPPPLGNLHPKDCRAVVKKMLNPNPKERIGMEEVLADPFMKGIDYAVPPTHPLPMP